MQIPNVPTDNLYKFLALTGLLILFVSIGYFEYRLHVHEVENAKIRVGKESLEYTTDNYFEELKDIADEISSRYETLKTNPELFNEKEARSLIDQYQLEYRKKLNRQYLTEKSMELRLMSELADASVLSTNRLRLWLIFSIFVGSGATLSGFYLWYHRLQKYQDEKLKHEINSPNQ